MRARVAAVPAISLLRRRRCWPPACYNLFARAVLTLHSNAKKLASSAEQPTHFGSFKSANTFRQGVMLTLHTHVHAHTQTVLLTP